MTIQVAVVDNDILALRCLSAALRQIDGISICHLAKNGNEAFDYVQRTMASSRAPDLMLVDMSMRHMSGIDLCEAVRHLDGRIILLGVTSYDPSSYFHDAVQSGMQGLMAKEEITRLPEILRILCNGGSWPDTREISFESPGQSHQRLHAQGKPFILLLSQRERRIMGLCARGFTNEEIAEQLGIAPSTVQTHIGRITAKLNVHGKREAIALWTRKVGL